MSIGVAQTAEPQWATPGYEFMTEFVNTLANAGVVPITFVDA